MYKKKEPMSDEDFYKQMYEITTSRIMDLQSMRLAVDTGRRIKVPVYIFEKTWAVNQYLHKYSYTMMKGLQ